VEKVLVTGASGYIALHCITELLKNGYAVKGSLRSMNRENEVREAVKKEIPDNNLEFCKLDLMSDEGWDSFASDCDYMIHLASPFIVGEPKNENELIKPATEGTMRALKAAKKASGKIKLIGVTILTSLNNKALKEIGFDKDIKKLVLHQARLASNAKLDAIVCSAQEVKLVKKVFKKEIITPGIRFSSKKHDQKRTLTPKQAIANGSNWLVIGRDITKGNIKKNIKKLINHLNR